jgi:UDP-glucose 4-epimerase
MKILLTGGAGYIGSHTCVALLCAGFEVVILDNFCNSQPEVMRRIESLTGKAPTLVRGDVCDAAVLQALFSAHKIAAVVHFAALKAVGESVLQPLAYYANNLVGMVSLLQAMRVADCYSLVYSSSATVYGQPQVVPITEMHPLGHTSPYGHTKLVGEEMLGALARAEPAWRFAVLRYFNPVGAHPSGQMGEDPAGPPNNLMPYVAQVAVGQRPSLNVYGNSYPTADGTGIRDYIHVMDLAEGHVAALQKLLAQIGSFTVNLGTGRGYSVLQVVKAFEAASGRLVPYQIHPRRAGDVASCYSDPSLAKQLLGWEAQLTLDDMCADTWRWQSQNPYGYAT